MSWNRHLLSSVTAALLLSFVGWGLIDSAHAEDIAKPPPAEETLEDEDADDEQESLIEKGPSKAQRNFVGSVQLDYLAVPTDPVPRRQSLDAATVELSLKMAMDFGDHTSAAVKICVACHGLEVGMAYFDLRVADELNFRLGRFTPAFGEFPMRHDPANHRTADKPLPYDMGRMLRLREWNMSVLPAPWVDNGAEVSGSIFFEGGSQFDYAAYAVQGPRAGADAVDFDYIQSRTPSLYYIDNNSRPTFGGRLSTTLELSDSSLLSLGASGMTGTYDPDNELWFTLVGADLVLQINRTFFRAEYLVRRTEMALGDDPSQRFRYGPGEDGTFDNFFRKEGWYTELEVPASSRLDLVARWDGMRRVGNVLNTSALRSESVLMRYTGALAYRIYEAMRFKLTAEFYDFSDFEDDVALHFGVAGTF